MNSPDTAPLAGAHIWLSGSIPENATGGDQDRIRQFVKCLAAQVFSLGGTIVFGWHPTLLEPLREAAQHYKSATNARAPLALYVSKWFSAEPRKNQIDLASWNDLCLEPVQETPRAFDSHRRPTEQQQAMSLSIMRQELAARCNAIVAIGGKWWTIATSKAGVSEEINLAAHSGLPLFLIGGMGGAVKGLLQARPDLLHTSSNGLSPFENEALASQAIPEKAVHQVVEQLQRLPLRAIPARNDRPFRILCLDGGGIRGVYTAAVLAYWEKAMNLHQPGRPRLVDHFDLVAGTSTGGILAVGLALGMSAADMQRFYESRGTRIFGTGEGLNKWWHTFRHWFTSKFDQETLRNELQDAYASSPVAQSGRPQTTWLDQPLCRLLIPAYNSKIDQPHLFRSPYGRFAQTDRGFDPVAVALSTAAAPTYFNPVTSRGAVADIQSVDGGIWANSPVSVAIAEAISEFQVSLGRIRLLSVGTTHTTELHGEPMKLDGNILGAFVRRVLPDPAGKIAEALWPSTPINGLVGWIPNITGLLMKAQSQTSDHLGRQLLGERYVRIDSESPYGNLDDVTRIGYFAGLGQAAASQAEPFARVQSLFLT
jgi:predicted acylesterase/phospholipase RssA